MLIFLKMFSIFLKKFSVFFEKMAVSCVGKERPFAMSAVFRLVQFGKLNQSGDKEDVRSISVSSYSFLRGWQR